MRQLVLASGSPRRRELLSLLTTDFVVRTAGIDETLRDGVLPAEAVRFLSAEKARAVWARYGSEAATVIGADTVVAVDHVLLGKPSSRDEAVRMLRRLSGREHDVFTGVTLLSSRKERSFAVRTGVLFYPLTDEEIQWYAGSREPYDKAGGYGIQGAGARFVRRLDGDFYNVMGLPVAEVYHQLQAFGFSLRDPEGPPPSRDRGS